MLTIFEGPDGAGKTTLVDRWEARERARGAARVVRFNNGPYEGAGGAELMGTYLGQLPGKFHPVAESPVHVLIDRCWISEMVYGNVMRGGSRLARAEINGLAYAAKDADVMVVMCLPSFQACRDAYVARRGREYLPDEDRLKMVYDAYAAMKANVDRRVFWYDREHDDPSTFIETVEDAR